MTTPSGQPLVERAEKIASGSASTMTIANAADASSNVAGSRSFTRSVAVLGCTTESPKSPRSAPAT